jgi:hypothetical protein
MDTVSIPKEQIYKVCFLDGTGKPKRIIVFQGKAQAEEVSKDDQIFSEEEQLSLSIDQPEITSSAQQIHKDDSLRILKKKIIKELGIHNVSYDELYLFSKKQDQLHLLKAFLEMTNNGQIEFTKHMAGQFLMNVLDDNRIKIAEEISKINLDVYTYDNFASTFQRDSDANENGQTQYNLIIPLGRKFSNSRDLLFSANPYSILPTTSLVYEPNNTNKLLTFDNHLLLNYGDIENNMIYVCFANDVLNYAAANSISEEHIIELYYPLLKEKDIISKQDLLESREILIEQTQQIMKDKTMKIYDIVDLYYNIFYLKTAELPYLERGVKSFHFVLHPEFSTVLPLDVIFKHFHVNPEIPYVKYNPGSRRESIYRLYTQQRTRNGKKIPYLAKNKITSLSKEPSKGHRLHIYIQKMFQDIGQQIAVFLDFDYNGNIIVRSEFNKAISIELVEKMVLDIVNPVIAIVNQLLEANGYKLATFTSLKDDFLEIININYSLLIDYKIDIKIADYIDFLSTVFEIIDKNISKGAVLKFKRVENYRKMDAMAAMITNILKHNDSEKDVIESLKINYLLTEDEALIALRDYLNQHVRIGGQFVNKAMDIAENPGFPVVLRTIPFENKLLIEIKDINSVDFVPILDMYLDSFLRITQYPATTTITKAQISEMSLNIRKTNDDSHVDNVVVSKIPDIQPFRLRDDDVELDEGGILFEEEDDDEVESSESENEADETMGGILFEEDEEEEEGSASKSKDASAASEEGGILFEEESSASASAKSANSSDSDDEVTKEYQEHKKQLAGAGNIFFKRLKERDPTLFLTKKEGNFGAYSGACPTNVSRQPVILTEEEKRDIDENYPGSYEVALPYSSNPDKKFWYICPRYWCVKKNRPMTEEQFKAGECDGITKVDSENVYEFTDNKEHKDKQGNYRQHRPGFLDNDAHPNSNLCVPCCFKNMNTEYQIRRRKECGIPDASLTTTNASDQNKIKRLVTPQSEIVERIKKYYKMFEKLKMADINKKLKEWEGREFELLDSLEEKYKEQAEELPVEVLASVRKQGSVDTVAKIKNIVHILGFEKYPIPQYRWGFLPISVELFLDTDSSDDVTKKNAAVLKSGSTPILRYGVEQSRNQSFLGCISDVYSYFHDGFIPTTENIRTTIAEKITIDIFLKSNNGSLVSVFQMPASKIQAISDIHVENYKQSQFYKSFTNLENPSQNRFLKDTVQAFENFLAYIRDPDSLIDYTYLWDILSMKDSVIFEGGINLMILEVVDHDIRDSVEFICPTNYYSDEIYDPKKGTILLLKRGEFFEPIYRYGRTNMDDSNAPNHAIKVFQRSNTPRSLLKVFEMIRRTSKDQCAPQQSIKKYLNKGVKMYEFKQNLPALTIHSILKKQNFVVRSQIMSYRGKVIALMVSNNIEDKSMVYLPTFPSSIINGLETKYIDDVIWLPYEQTVKRLASLHGNVGESIRCAPKLRVVEDGLIVGILTETNQFVQVAEPFEPNDAKYGNDFIETVSYKNDYYGTDNKLATSDAKDDIRIKTIRNISLESQFYSAFRIKIRSVLNEYSNKDVKKQIIDIIDSIQFTYVYKLKKIIDLLFGLTKNVFSFVEISEQALYDFTRLSTVSNYSDIQSLCLTKKGTVCVPSKNLVDSSKSNNTIYYAKIADELLRYGRIRSFILEPKRYLNISNTDYSVRKDEIILLHSILFGTYFDDLMPFEMNQYIQNINYDTANPALSTERFKNKVQLDDQVVLDNKTTDLTMFGECLDTPRLIIEPIVGDAAKNWRNIFPEGTKESLVHSSELCSFYPLIFVIKKLLGREESPESIKMRLWKIYQGFIVDYKPYLYSILSIQGKSKLATVLKKGNPMDFESAIMSDDYFITNLDLWLLAENMNLPIVLFCSNKMANLTYQHDWYIFGGNKDIDSFYFIRCEALRTASELETYSIVDKPFRFSELRAFEEEIINIGLHNTKFLDYIKTYPIKIQLKI